MSLVRVKGSSWDSSDNIVVDVIDDLYDITQEGIIFVSGGSQANDGSGGWFRYDPVRPRSEHDGNNVIDPSKTLMGRGCWVRQQFDSSIQNLNFNELFTAAAGQTVFSLKRFTYSPNTGSLSIYVNGVRLTPWTFTEVDPSTVELNYALRAGDVVEIIHKESGLGGIQKALDAIQVNFDDTVAQMGVTDVQAALDAIAQTLAVPPGGIPGGGTLHASKIPYTPLTPDISTTIQNSMHWMQNRLQTHVMTPANAHSARAIGFDTTVTGFAVADVQEAIDAMFGILGESEASKVVFNPLNVPFHATNVQQAIELTVARTAGNQDSLNTHIGKLVNAHAASAISLNLSNDPLLAQVGTVARGLETLSQAMGTHTQPASSVLFDGHAHNMGQTVDDALMGLYGQLQGHLTQGTAAHTAWAIRLSPITGLSAANVQGVAAELYDMLKAHISLGQNVHDAAAINFVPGQGIAATNVQAAIIESSAGKQIYMGHLYAGQPWQPPGHVLQNNQYFTIPDVGPMHSSWYASFANVDPAVGVQLSGNGLAIFDGVRFWYQDLTRAQNAIIGTPGPGITQSIVTALPTDTALMLAGKAGQSAPVLLVEGTASVIGDFRAAGSIHDMAGSVRQDASEVPFAPVPGSSSANTVQTAIEDTLTKLSDHFAGSIFNHPADHISFSPVLGINSTTAQLAIEQVQKNLDDHKASVNAHVAGRIRYDNTSTGLNGVTVQESIDELVQELIQHIQGLANQHEAKGILVDVTNLPGVTATDLQGVLEELRTFTDLNLDIGIF